MYDEPRLSDEEWDLVVELLECERNELPVEIHHTRNSEVRGELQQRADMVSSLLSRLQRTAAV
jgi:hypothetical protein